MAVLIKCYETGKDKRNRAGVFAPFIFREKSVLQLHSLERRSSDVESVFKYISSNDKKKTKQNLTLC